MFVNSRLILKFYFFFPFDLDINFPKLLIANWCFGVLGGLCGLDCRVNNPYLIRSLSAWSVLAFLFFSKIIFYDP